MFVIILAVIVLVLILPDAADAIRYLGWPMSERVTRYRRRKAVDRNKSIIERNSQTIEACLAELLDNYLAESVRAFESAEPSAEKSVLAIVEAIAEKEGSPGLTKKVGKWMESHAGSNGVSGGQAEACGKPDFPEEYVDLVQHLRMRVQELLGRYDELAKRRRAEAELVAEQKRKRDDIRRKNLYHRHSDLIRALFEDAERRLGLIDQNGNENRWVLSWEVRKCVLEIAEKEGTSFDEWVSHIHYGTTLSEEKLEALGDLAWLYGEIERSVEKYHPEQKACFGKSQDSESMFGDQSHD